jgi:hypothetical protein
MRKKYGKEKGDEVFWGWTTKHKYDETKSLSQQKNKAEAQDILDVFPDDFTEEDSLNDEPLVGADSRYPPQTDAPPPVEQAGDMPLHDQLNRTEDASAKASAEASGFEASQFMSIPAYRIPYTAEPKFQSESAPLVIKAIVLEEGHNVNNWRVLPDEFEKVAEQYKAGRQLRVNHGKDVQDVIGKSFDGRVIKGKDIALYLGKEMEGIDPEGKYVAAEFEASPQNPQVRANILSGYVVSGSIGLDAEAFCEECDKPLKTDKEGNMERSCRHFDAPVKLRNVEVKEYSYVAEPAFEHTKAFPSFSAAVQSRLGGSSLNSQKPTEKVEMPDAPTVAVTAKAQEGKKAEGEGQDADSKKTVADAIAEGIALYKRGFSDAMKFRADDTKEPDEDDVPPKKGDASAKADGQEGQDASVKATAGAKPKTDQVARTAPARTMKSPPDLMARVLRPTDYALQDPAMREIFKASADTAPSTVKGILMQNLKGRFE